jgi:hypothetical protein
MNRGMSSTVIPEAGSKLRQATPTNVMSWFSLSWSALQHLLLCAVSSPLTNNFSAMAAKPQFLSGDKAAIDEFLSRFDVSVAHCPTIPALTPCRRSSFSTVMVRAHLLHQFDVSPDAILGVRSCGGTLIVKKDRRPLVRRSPLSQSPGDARNAEKQGYVVCLDMEGLRLRGNQANSSCS